MEVPGGQFLMAAAGFSGSWAYNFETNLYALFHLVGVLGTPCVSNFTEKQL